MAVNACAEEFVSSEKDKPQVSLQAIDRSDDEKVGRLTDDDVYSILLDYQENNAGRLVLDPGTAPVELGTDVAKRLKLSSDGTKILWPQPTESPEDPQNAGWSHKRKNMQLGIVTIAALVPGFDGSIGIAAVFAIADQFHTSANTVNQKASSWAVFSIGLGGIFAVMMIRRYGRLPVLFWSQLSTLGFLVGCTFAPNLNTSSAMRCLAGFAGACAQVSGLYVVTDMYPLHLQARKLTIWTTSFVISPVLAPFFFGFLVARANWRWTYGIGALFSVITVLLVAIFMEETWFGRRSLRPEPLPRAKSVLYQRLLTLVGVTGARTARGRAPWTEIMLAPLKLVWRPHLLAALLCEGILFGYGIGFHTTNTVLLALPAPKGYGFGAIQIAATYSSSIVASLMGEIIARYLIDWLLEVAVRRNKGVFEAECRLWACYPAMLLFVVGFILQGAAFKDHLHVAVLVVGWICAQIAVMIGTSAIYAYCNDCFPKNKGEVSALLNFARCSLGGFSVSYYQVDWVNRDGALAVFGAEAGIIAGLFMLCIPALQVGGRSSRARFSV